MYSEINNNKCSHDLKESQHPACFFSAIEVPNNKFK